MLLQEHSGSEHSGGIAPAVSPSDARLPATAILSTAANGAPAALSLTTQAEPPPARDQAGGIQQVQPDAAVASTPDGAGRSKTGSMQEGSAIDVAAKDGDESEPMVLATSDSAPTSAGPGSSDGECRQTCRRDW